MALLFLCRTGMLCVLASCFISTVSIVTAEPSAYLRYRHRKCIGVDLAELAALDKVQ